MGGTLLFRERPRQVPARPHPELAVGGREVLLDGLVAHVERLGDLPVRASLRREPGDPPLVGREGGGPAELRPARTAPAISSSVLARSASGAASQRIARSSACRSGSRASTRRRRCRSATPRSASARACSSRAGEAASTSTASARCSSSSPTTPRCAARSRARGERRSGGRAPPPPGERPRHLGLVERGAGQGGSRAPVHGGGVRLAHRSPGAVPPPARRRARRGRVLRQAQAGAGVQEQRAGVGVADLAGLPCASAAASAASAAASSPRSASACTSIVVAPSTLIRPACA